MFQKHAYFILYKKEQEVSLNSLLSQLAHVMSPLTAFGYDGFPYGWCDQGPSIFV